jgi:hypothetical protein
MSALPAYVFPEPWHDLDTAYWTPTDPSTGIAWDVTSDNDHRTARAVPNDTEDARLVHTTPYACSPTLLDDSASMFKGFIMEFGLRLTNVANIDNNEFFVGLSTSNSAIRTTNDIIGFILSSDELTCIEDDGGGEDTEQLSYTLTDWHWLRIEIWGGTVLFYVDDLLVHTVVSALTGTFYPNFYTKASGGATGLYVGELNLTLTPTPKDINYGRDVPFYRVKEDTDIWFPIIMREKNNPEKPIIGKLSSELVYEYWSVQNASAFSSYVPSSNQFVEVDQGIYKLQMGASEFENENDLVIIRISDSKYSAETVVMAAVVNEHTVDEVYDKIYAIAGGGNTNTYNITNMMKEQKRDFRDVGYDLKKLFERLNALRKRSDKDKIVISQIKKQLDDIEKEVK